MAGMEPRTHLRVGCALAAALVCAGGCGGRSPPATIGNAAAGPPPPSLADDLAAMARIVERGDQNDEWLHRATFLGWTADHRIAYRVLVCDGDLAGERGPYCELLVCAVGDAGDDAEQEPLSFNQPSGDPGEPCASAADSPPGDADFSVDDAAREAERLVDRLGPLAAGTARAMDDVDLSIDGLALTVAILAGPPRVVIAHPDVEGWGVVGATPVHVGDSPDGRCRGVVGMAAYTIESGPEMDEDGELGTVWGKMPLAFAAVRCAAD